MRYRLCLCILAVLGSEARPAGAVGEPSPSAASAQTVKLPDGPGSIRGLSASPEVRAFTGQASYQVPFELPAAAGGFQPSLALTYQGGAGNGPVGLGWHIEYPRIERSTRLGTPRYQPADE